MKKYAVFLILPILFISSASAVTVYNGTIIKPNSTSTGYYLLYSDAVMDELSVNSTNLSFTGIIPIQYVDVFFSNWTLVKEYPGIGNLTLGYTDSLRYIKFNSSSNISVTPGGGGSGYFIGGIPIVEAETGQPEVAKVPDYVIEIGIIIIFFIIFLFWRRKKKKKKVKPEQETKIEEPKL